MHHVCIPGGEIKPRGLLKTNIECFSALWPILCILRKGEMSNAIHGVLTALVPKHNRLFLDLYGKEHAKIKFHHTYHIADDMLYVMQCLSCFPTERKNKDALALSVATDKNIEKASVIALLHSTLSHWNDARGCEEVYLHNPRPMCLHEEKVSKSVSATLTCGDVYTHDMVLLFDGSIGKVLSFRQHDDSIHVGVQVHRAIPNAELLFGIRVHEVNFVDDRSTVEPIFWYAKANAILAIVPQFGC